MVLGNGRASLSGEDYIREEAKRLKVDPSQSTLWARNLGLKGTAGEEERVPRAETLGRGGRQKKELGQRNREEKSRKQQSQRLRRRGHRGKQTERRIGRKVKSADLKIGHYKRKSRRAARA
jgi:hypothetical protein